MPEAQKEKAAKGGDAKSEKKVKRGEAPAPAKLATAESMAVPAGYTPRMKQHYNDVGRAKLIEQFGYKNALEVPHIEKIVLNMGVGEAVNDTKKVTTAAADLALIAGQRPVVTRARNAISTFKVRENMPIGAKSSSTVSSRSRFRAFATSAASTRSRSTDAAISRWASRSTSCFPRSTTTRSTRSWVWT
jgi:large subunit ribosomal protein L5